MNNLLRVEFYKLIRSKVFWTLVGVIIFGLFLLMLISWMAYNELLVSNDSFEVTVDDTEDINGFTMLTESIKAPSVFMIILLVTVLGAFLISTEYSTGVIKNIVSIGYNRSQIYLAKLIILSLGSIILSLIIPVISSIYAMLFFEIGELPDLETVVSSIKYILLTCLFVISITSIVVLFAMTLSGRGMTLVVSFVFYLLVNNGLGFLANQFKIFADIQTYSIYYRFSSFSVTEMSLSNIIELTAISLATTLLFTIIGMVIFKRKDIQ